MVLQQPLISLSIWISLISRYHTAAHHERLEKVMKDIEKNGIYEQTTSELTFGAKTAWRNASRCIGRIQWSKLQVGVMKRTTNSGLLYLTF